MGRWAFVLTDNDFQPLGEILNASNRQIALPLNGLPTASFHIPLSNSRVNDILNLSGYLKAYRTDNTGVRRLEFYGPIISAEESISNNQKSVAVNAVGVGWILSKRLSGSSATGTTYTNTDRALIVKSLVLNANGDGETNISTQAIVTEPSPYVSPGSGGFEIITGGGAQTLSPGQGASGEEGVRYAASTTIGRPSSGSTDPNFQAASAVNYTAGPYKPTLDCIRELSAGVDGFDWQIVPFDNYTGGIVGSLKIGQIRCYPIIGSRRTDAVFEYGEGRKNVQEYNRTISRDTQANKVYHNATAGPDAPGYPTVSALDPHSIASFRLLEDLAQADLLDQTLRQALVGEHVRVRAYPRQTATFTPALMDPASPNRVPQYRDNYIVGDQVRARIISNNRVRLDAWMRIYGVNFDIDNNGTERVSLGLAQE